MHDRSCFITLTYDQEHVPADGSVDVSHWQKFAKRVRKALGPFRFYHCGEYGELNKRPHYHALLFGLDFSFDRQALRTPREQQLYTSPTLASLWGQGQVSMGDLTFESAAYVARYCMKKLGGDLADKEYERFDSQTGEVWSVRPPYTTMSRRPGIGSAWLDRFKSDVYAEDEVVSRGRRYKPPRYYDSKLPEGELEAIKATRQREAAKHQEDQTYERLRVRENVAVARLGKLQRQL